MKNFKKIESKKLFSLLMAVVMILQVLVITPTYAADIRTKISTIEATSNTDSIPKYGEKVKDPTFTVTAGKPAYFDVYGSGDWRKKEGTEWKQYWGETFTEGTYKYTVQIRIDGEAGTTHVLDSNGVTATVDGNKWADNRRASVDDKFSLVWTESKEYVITAPAGTPLNFVKDNSWDIGLNYVGRAIKTFSVAAGVAGGEKPYTFSKFSGPDWISVASDGTVSGTPTSVGTNEDLVIRVTDNASTTKEITLTVAKTAQDPSTRTKISKIVATSNTDSIPTYGGKTKNPTFTVTAGKPAYFDVEGSGDWRKKEGTEWKQYWGETFTEGTYKYTVQIRIDGEAGTTHVLDSNGVTATVDGNKWADNRRASVDDKFSLVWTESKEYVITKTSQEIAIDIPKANTNLVYNGNPQTGVNEGTGYTLTDNTATNAGTYTAKATLKAGYKWRDGSTDVKEISWSIAKARPTFTEPTGLKGQKGTKLSTVALTSGFTWVDGETVLNTVGENTFKAKFTPADTTNYEVIDVDLTVKVEDVVTPPEQVTLTTNIINGHGTVTVTPNTATVDKGNTIEVTFNPETNYEIGTVTLDGTNVKSQVVSNRLTITMDKSKTLWVTFKEKPVTPPPTVQSIKVISTDHKTEYKVGDSLDVTNLKIEATMSDGTKEQIFVTKEMVSGFDSSTAGTKTLTITYQDKTTIFTINVTASSTPPTPTVDSIKVISTDHKTEYKVGEDLDVTNLTIEVTKSDGSTQTVNVDKSMVTGFDSSAANPSQELTITYEGKTTTYTIKIEEVAPPAPTVTSIAVNSTNHKTDYKVGEDLDVTNLTIEVTKSDGSTQTVNVDKSMVKGFDSSTANPNQELTITYEGKTATYTVKIEEVTPPTKTYTVSFDGNDGGGTMPSKTVNAGDIYKLPVSTFTPPVGKEFKAWEVNGVEKTVGTDITINSNTVLKAIWKDKSVTPPTPPTSGITPNPWGPRYEYNPFWQIYFGSTEQIAPKQTIKEKTEVVITIGSKIMERAINGVNEKIMMDIAPFIEGNRTMLPIRFVAEALGFKVEWISKSRTVVLTNRDNVVKIPVNTNQIIVNGKVFESDVKPVLKDNRTMLPVANIARALGLKDGTDILWDETTKKVTIIREQIID